MTANISSQRASMIFFSEPIFVPYSRGAFWTLTFNLVIISMPVTWGDWDDEHWKKWSIFRPGWSILWTSDPFSDQARHQLNLNFSRLKMTNFQFFLAKYNLDIYIFNIYLLKVKIFKKIKCKFAVKDEVRLLSLKVIHYPNIALYAICTFQPSPRGIATNQMPLNDFVERKANCII